MADLLAARPDFARLLDAVENAPPVDAADVLGGWLAGALGAYAVSFLIVDLSGRALIRLGHASITGAVRTQGHETAKLVALAGTPHGRTLLEQAVEVEIGAGEVRLYAPVTNRGEAIGVLKLSLPEAPDEQTLADVALAAHALAYIIIANRRFTDLFEWGQRSVRLSLAAEIQHRLLPGAFTCESGQARSPPGSSRPARSPGPRRSRRLAGLREGGGRPDRPPSEDGDRRQRGTSPPLAPPGRAGRVGPRSWPTHRSGLRGDTTTECSGYRWNRGIGCCSLPTACSSATPRASRSRPLMVRGAEMHPREAVQHIVLALLDATDGDLEDDAAAMCLDWHGGPPRERTAESGANDRVGSERPSRERTTESGANE